MPRVVFHINVPPQALRDVPEGTVFGVRKDDQVCLRVKGQGKHLCALLVQHGEENTTLVRFDPDVHFECDAFTCDRVHKHALGRTQRHTKNAVRLKEPE